jgi:hypothetical protein
MSFLVIAACGGSHKPAPPPSNGESSSEAAVAMEPDQVDAEAQVDQEALARQQAIQAARDAGVLGNGSGSAAPAAVPGVDPRDKPAIRAVVQGELKKIQYCYEKQLLVTPSLAGKITIQFVIEPDGHVSSSKATSGFDPNVSTCLAGVISGAQFAPVTDGSGTVLVNYPFVFNAPASAPAPTP